MHNQANSGDAKNRTPDLRRSAGKYIRGNQPLDTVEDILTKNTVSAHMIEIVPHNDCFRGSYNVASSVDLLAYMYIYNEVFIDGWNQYIKEVKADSNFIKSKWIVEESDPVDAGSLDTLSWAEKIERARKVSEFSEYRRGKKGKYFQQLVDGFDRERNLITCYKLKFYTYEIETKFADHISVYLIEEHKITDMVNCLYLKIKKRDRCMTRKQLIGNFEINDDD